MMMMQDRGIHSDRRIEYYALLTCPATHKHYAWMLIRDARFPGEPDM
jgi:hypothetical protein